MLSMEALDQRYLSGDGREPYRHTGAGPSQMMNMATGAYEITSSADLARLIEAVAAQRDRQAFTALFDYFAPRIKAVLMRSNTPPAAAEELAQDAMLTVWRKAAQFDRTRAGASAWIFTIARNLRIDIARREQRGKVLDLEANFCSRRSSPTRSSTPTSANSWCASLFRNYRTNKCASCAFRFSRAKRMATLPANLNFHSGRSNRGYASR
jgi:RNA polymerase sigma factor (sigma-70 family)